MWTGAARRSICAACLAVISLRQSALVSAATCPSFPADSFQAAVARKATTCVDPTGVQAVQIPVGHVALNGIELVPAGGAKCSSATDELKALIEPVPNALTRGSSSCTLKNIVLEKSDNTPQASMKMRLDFDKCTQEPSTAAVLVDVVPVADTVAAPSMFPFWETVCTVQTTTPVTSMASLRLTFTEALVGNGTCDGTAFKTFKNDVVQSKQTCKLECIADIQKEAYSAAGMQSAAACKGYSYVESAAVGAEVCKLYSSADGAAIEKTKEAAATECYSLIPEGQPMLHESTPQPLTPEQLAALEAKLPKFSVPIQAATANILTFSSGDNCFATFDWITLDDATGNTATLGVKQTEFAQLLELIPNKEERKLETVPDVKAIIAADRTVFGAAVQTTPAPAMPGVTVPPEPALPPCPVEPVAPDYTLTHVLSMLALITGGLCFYVGYATTMPKETPAPSPAKAVGGPVSPMASQAQPGPQASGGPTGPMGPSGGPSGPGGPSMGGPSGPSMGGPSGPSMGGPSGSAMGGPGPSGPNMGGPGPMGPSEGQNSGQPLLGQ